MALFILKYFMIKVCQLSYAFSIGNETIVY